MRRTPLFALLSPLLLTAACGGSTEPRVFSIAGTWESAGLAGAEIRMTLVETARAVVGAGHWITPSATAAFRASGASVGESASVLMDFDGRDDVNFQGRYDEVNDTTVLIGQLHGGGFRATPVTFRRVDD